MKSTDESRNTRSEIPHSSFLVPHSSFSSRTDEHEEPSKRNNESAFANYGQPPAQGLYDPAFEHDACGVGFVVDLKNRKSHDVIVKGIQILLNLKHRGACGCETNTGDGAGILVQMPERFFGKEAARLGWRLPRLGDYGVGMVFLPSDTQDRARCEQIFEKIVRDEGQHVIGWRTVPTDNSPIGPGARAAEPVVRQIFIGNAACGLASDGARPQAAQQQDSLAFERKLYIIRKLVENAIRRSNLPQRERFYVPSLSCKTIIYKGMLNSDQVTAYYPDLNDPDMESALAMVHSRFSTNTFPTWPRAHPYRYVCHNGEINTLRGNVNWMHARQSLLASELFGEDISKIQPIIDASGSDSAMFDNVLEMLVLTGRSLPHAVMMMIPEPWTPLGGMRDEGGGMKRGMRDEVRNSDSSFIPHPSSLPSSLIPHHSSLDLDDMSPEKRAFYEYHACLMEPWDGPASIAFTDGIRIGAVLDRNGLRPSRYYVTHDDLVIMASEVGVLDIPPENVKSKGRLQPGRMFLIDLEQGRIIADEELKRDIASKHPYAEWLRDNSVSLEDLPKAPPAHEPDHGTVLLRQQVFGYTYEDQHTLIAPMAEGGNEAVGSMGNDAALAVLSDRPQLLYSYFKQLFAQVTNPPVDCIREEIIMSTAINIGREYNLLKPSPQSARQIKLKSPILMNHELDKLRQLEGTTQGRFKSMTLPAVFKPKEGADGLERAITALCKQAASAVATGTEYIILSDRAIDKHHAPIPALLAVSGVHHYLIREGTRTQVSLVLESGEPREVHHFALLIGYGCGGINPYLAFETIEDMIEQGHLQDADPAKYIKNYVKAINKGVLKVVSKMGISTVQSYCGAQIFEAIGLGKEVIDRYFTGTPSRIGGIGLDYIAQEVRERHDRAYTDRSANGHTLEVGGHYQYRKDGEFHLFNPETVHKLQYACRTGNYNVFKQYSKSVNDQSVRLCTLRGLIKLPTEPDSANEPIAATPTRSASEALPADPAAQARTSPTPTRRATDATLARSASEAPLTPIPIAEVESVEEIVKRFKTGAMSYGSISKEAHETLAIAMNRLGGKSNTGEGGEDPARYTLDENGDSRNSAIKQVASARFGVTSNYLVNAQELQIKMAQGAKPGEGGQLPGHKVYPWIAKVRHATPGVGLISPPPHHDIYSIEDLAELIYDLKNANHRARISVKLVAEVGVGTVAAGVSKAHADVVLISGHDGGTGASPLTSIKHAGIPWELGLAETQQTLLLNDLRSRIVVEVDGQLKTGRDVVIGALLGAEEFGFATGPLVALGCIMMRVCHLNTCPVGVATQDPELRKKFTGDAKHVENFMRFMAEEVREIMAQLGFRHFNDMVGRSDLLRMGKAIEHYKTLGLDFSKILLRPNVPANVDRYCTRSQEHGLEAVLDNTTLLKLCEPALKHGRKVREKLPIRNVHRVVGTIVGSAITRRYGPEGLPDDTIRLHFEGSAGQSFGAFIPRGMTLILEGDSNDHLGKGLSGGKIIVYPPAGSTFVPEENVIVGNVALYGGTAGEAYINGVAGERFAVRNSGVHAVVDAVGDHGCEYMTGGRVVILSSTGRNFAAGMSGGIAYVLDEHGDFPRRCNTEMVSLCRLDDPEEIAAVRTLIRRHAEYTGSDRATRILDAWEQMVPKFVKVYPNDFRRVIETQKRYRAQGLPEEEAIMAAFEENAHDMARAGGK